MITGQEFYDALKAGTLNPAAREIADEITGSEDNLDRVGGLYEFAYRGALAGLTAKEGQHGEDGV